MTALKREQPDRVAIFELVVNEPVIKGSFLEAVEADIPRTVVFEVSGIIELKRPLQIEHPYIKCNCGSLFSELGHGRNFYHRFRKGYCPVEHYL